MTNQPSPFHHLVIDAERARRRERIQSGIAPFVGRRLAGAWANRRYPDFRSGEISPAEVAEGSEAGVDEVLAYIARIGPSLKGTDWSGSGWVGKGPKSRPRRR